MKRKRTENISGIKVVILGAVCSLALLAVVCFIASLILIRTENSTAYIDISSLAALLVTAAISGFSISKIKGDGGVLIGILSSLLFVLVMLVIGLIAMGGSLPPRCPLNYLCYMGVASLFSLLGKKRVKRRR